MTFFSPPNGNYLLNASRCDLEESHIPTTRLKLLPCKFSRLGCSGCGFAPWFVEALFTGCVHLLGDQRCRRPLPRPGRCESAASSALIQLECLCWGCDAAAAAAAATAGGGERGWLDWCVLGLSTASPNWLYEHIYSERTRQPAAQLFSMRKRCNDFLLLLMTRARAYLWTDTCVY